MPSSENPKSEQFSQAINTEIEQKVSERLKELEERLDQRFQASIRDDRAFVKDTIGVAFKVAGFAVAVVVVVLGALGLKTYFDFHKIAIDTATEVAKKITEDHFQAPAGKRITESVLDHAVLDSYLARFLRMDAENWPTSTKIKIEDPDVDRLLRIIKSDETNDSDFEAAAYVLMRGSVAIGDVRKTLKGFITADGKGKDWRDANKKKRRWLLKALKESPAPDDEMTTACRELISSSDKDENELKLPAIAYLGAAKDHAALDELLRLAETEKGKELGDEAVLAIARMQPTDEVVKNWVAGVDNPPNPPAGKIATALQISEAFKDEREALDTRLKLLEFAAQHSRLSIDLFRLRHENKKTPRFIDVWGAEHSKSSIPSTILFEGEDRWTQPVQDILRKYAQQEDLNDFTRFIRWLTVSPGGVSVRLLLQNCTVALEKGEIVDKQSAPDGVVVLCEPAKRDGKLSEQIKVVWTDPEKQPRSGVLTKFENAKDLKFLRQDLLAR